MKTFTKTSIILAHFSVISKEKHGNKAFFIDFSMMLVYYTLSKNYSILLKGEFYQ